MRRHWDKSRRLRRRRRRRGAQVQRLTALHPDRKILGAIRIQLTELSELQPRLGTVFRIAHTRPAVSRLVEREFLRLNAVRRFVAEPSPTRTIRDEIIVAAVEGPIDYGLAMALFDPPPALGDPSTCTIRMADRDLEP